MADAGRLGLAGRGGGAGWKPAKARSRGRSGKVPGPPWHQGVWVTERQPAPGEPQPGERLRGPLMTLACAPPVAGAGRPPPGPGAQWVWAGLGAPFNQLPSLKGIIS